MNARDKVAEKNRNWHKYHVPGGSAYKTVKRNCVFTHASNSLIHELCKAALGHEANRLGLEYVTEAVECGGGGLRRDLVVLDSGNVYEVETDRKRAARFAGTSSVVCLIEGMDLEAAVVLCVNKLRDNE